MGWIVGKKSDESLVLSSLKKPDFEQSELESIVPAKYGGVAGDYSYYHMSQDDWDKIKDGWEYDLTWSGGEITAVDYTPETSKRWVKITLDKTEIEDGGSTTKEDDRVTVTLEIWKADMSGIDTNVTTSSKIPILTPDGERWTKASVVNGVKTKVFATTKSGNWVFPSRSKRFANVRVVDQSILEVVETNILG